MNRQTIIVPYVDDRCENYLVVRVDDYIPSEWRCPFCEDALDRQERDAWADAEMQKVIERGPLAVRRVKDS